MTHIAEHKVRSYECDSYNHVNNSVYLNYLEYGRMEFLNAIGFDFKAVTEAGYYLYVTHIDIYYKSSAFLDDVLDHQYTFQCHLVKRNTLHDTHENELR